MFTHYACVAYSYRKEFRHLLFYLNRFLFLCKFLGSAPILRAQWGNVNQGPNLLQRATLPRKQLTVRTWMPN